MSRTSGSHVRAELEALERHSALFQEDGVTDELTPEQRARVAEIRERITQLRQLLDTESH